MLRYVFHPAAGADARPDDFAKFARSFKGLMAYHAPYFGPESVAVETDLAHAGALMDLVSSPIRTTFGLYFAGRG